MPRKIQDVTDAELAVLRALWAEGSASVRQIAAICYPKMSTSDLATVQKLLARLEAKGCAGRDRRVWPHQFFAAIEREELIAKRLQLIADQLCDGSLSDLATQFFKNGKPRRLIE